MKRKAQQTLMALALVGSGVGGGLWISELANANAIAQTAPEAIVAQAVPSGPSSFVADVAEQVPSHINQLVNSIWN
ncbi:MAG: hypothetical protein AAGA01_17600 [Cyanobacteria bacterium P01_E01_bin.43]